MRVLFDTPYIATFYINWVKTSHIVYLPSETDQNRSKKIKYSHRNKLSVFIERLKSVVFQSFNGIIKGSLKTLPLPGPVHIYINSGGVKFQNSEWRNCQRFISTTICTIQSVLAGVADPSLIAELDPVFP